jgi:23S rRNA maturation mini-RNase III
MRRRSVNRRQVAGGASSLVILGDRCFRTRLLFQTTNPRRTFMPTMSDTRRKKIQAKQRKAENTRKREAKIAKRERNAKAGAAR